MNRWRVAAAGAALLFISCFYSEDTGAELPPELEGLTVSTFEVQTAEVASDGLVRVGFKSRVGLESLSIAADRASGRIEVQVARLSGTPLRLDPPARADVYDYIRVAHDNLSDSGVGAVTIVFAIDTDWIESQGRRHEDIVLARYTGSWSNLPTRSIGQRGSDSRFEAISPGLSLFAIIAKTTDESEAVLRSPSPTPSVTPTSSPPPAHTPTAIPSGIIQTAVPTSVPESARSPVASRTPTPARTGSIPTPTPQPTALARLLPRELPTATPLTAPSATPDGAGSSQLSPTPSPTATRTATPTTLPTMIVTRARLPPHRPPIPQVQR